MPEAKTKPKTSKTKEVLEAAVKKSAAKPKAPLAVERKESKRYFEAVGRRKRAVARVRVFTANPKDSAIEGNFTINDKNIKDYFTLPFLRELALESLNKLRAADHFRVSVKARGGGINAQAEAIRLGIARALIKFDPNFRRKLKKSILLRRDPREKERRKYGLKKARRAPQFSKR